MPVTVIVPVYNEEKYIETKLKNLLEQDYPKDMLEIIVVDNGSNDKTKEIIKSFDVKLLESERGKVKAINRALEEVQNEIVIITDADVLLKRNAIRDVIKYFDYKIGAISGKVDVKGKNFFYMRSKLGFYYRDWDLRYIESLLDSCCSLDARLVAFRRSLINKFPEGTVVDDFELTFLIRKQGYRGIITEESLAQEKCPMSLKGEIEQLRRRTAMGIITSIRHINILFNPKYGYFGLMTFPFRRILTFFMPFIMIYQFLYLWFFIGFKFLIFFSGMTAFFLLVGESYHVIVFIAMLLGWFDVFFKKVKSGGIWDRVQPDSSEITFNKDNLK
ncbi:glycosyltransferase [bacterium]|nr:glycosyltransferase [bacterium]